MFHMFDAEGIKTERRSMKQFVYDSPEFYNNPTKYAKHFREFYEHLVQFDGNFEEFSEAYKSSENPTEQWFMKTNNNLKHGHFAFMTLDMGSMTNHVAGAIAMLNITGDSMYEAPVGGYHQYSKKAAALADLVLTNTKVSAVKPSLAADTASLMEGKAFVSGPVAVSWSRNGVDQTEDFDAVIMCVGAPDIETLFPNFDLPTDGWSQTITVHKTHHADSEAFFNMHEVGPKKLPWRRLSQRKQTAVRDILG